MGLTARNNLQLCSGFLYVTALLLWPLLLCVLWLDEICLLYASQKLSEP